MDFNKPTQSLDLEGTLGIMVEVGLCKKEVIITDIKDIEDIQKFVKTYELDNKGQIKCVNIEQNLRDTKYDTGKDVINLERNVQGYELEMVKSV